MPDVLVLSGADVRRVLTPGDCIEVMAAVLAARARGEAFMPLRSIMAAPGANGFMGLMPAWSSEAGFALKAICVMPGNPARGLDAHQGTVTLFHGETGIPTAILDASAVTEIRTAAVSAVATRALARADASVLAVLGAGVQGRSHIEALRLVRPFTQVRVFAPTREHAQALAGDGVLVADSAEAAVRGADVVVCATSSRTPVLERAWLSAGAHVNAVGASTPSARELDTATVASASVFADSRESVAHEAGEFQLAVREGVISGLDHLRGELGDVLIGSVPGRADDAELTVFRSLGLAVEDLAAAQFAVAGARRLGLGVEVAL
jgi:ornithine cyclodeaminase/alanine dehydrogenase-like protein (mu-crystallin family)